MWKETWRRWALSGGCSPVSERRIAAVLDSWLPNDLSVTIYHALDGEPSLDAIVDPRRRWLVPRVEGDTMTFHEWGAETETLAFGLRQPTSAAPVVPASEIDVMVIPGMAFDRRGVRLGRGGGFYDRFLSAHPRIDTVGVITAARLVERLPRESHDATVDHIAIEAGVASVGSA